MAQVINTNMMSLNSQRALNKSQMSMTTSLERLSSGLRINRAKDDAAGLAISERITSQVRGLDQAVRNANDGISLLQTAEGALSEVTNSLQRMRELAVQSANGTYNSSDRQSLQDEFSALQAELTRTLNVTEFNNVNLLGNAENTSGFSAGHITSYNTSVAQAASAGTAAPNNPFAATALDMQVGWENGADNIIPVSTQNLNDTSANGGMRYVLSAALSIGSNAGATGARQAMSFIDNALSLVTSIRGDFGAIQNRLESSVRNMENVIENQSAARSRIMDADFARETANLTRTQILQQAGTAMLAQANQLPQNILSLLQ